MLKQMRSKRSARRSLKNYPIPIIKPSGEEEVKDKDL